MIKCLLTELGRAGRENIWPSVMAHGPRCARSVHHDLGPNIFPSGPPTQSISTYYLAAIMKEAYWVGTLCMNWISNYPANDCAIHNHSFIQCTEKHS